MVSVMLALHIVSFIIEWGVQERKFKTPSVVTWNNEVNALRTERGVPEEFARS